MTAPILSQASLNTIFDDCRQCGTCCKQYRRILLQPDEAEYITKMGGHVGVDLELRVIREKGIKRATEDAKKDGKVYMIHPDDKGCVFLQKRNEKYMCKLYNFRPKTCRGFKCNFADTSAMSLLSEGAIHLLGQNSFGLPLEKK